MNKNKRSWVVEFIDGMKVQVFAVCETSARAAVFPLEMSKVRSVKPGTI